MIGGAIGKLTGDTNTGEAGAWSSTKFNWLNHKDAEYYKEQIQKAESEKEAKYYQYKKTVQD